MGLQIKFDTVIFDLGGVLIDWEPRRLFRKIFDDETEMEHFLTTVCTPEWNMQQDKGRALSHGTRLLIDEFPNYESQISAFYGRWEEMLGGPIQGTVDILHELKSTTSCRLLALTNWSSETFGVALNKYDFLEMFEGILVSGQEKLVKPEQPFYELLCSRYQVDLSGAIFIDDTPINIKGAETFGIRGILFKSSEQLRQDLESLSILRPSGV